MNTNHIEIETLDQLRVAAPDLAGQVVQGVDLTAVSYTHLTLPTTRLVCRSRWWPDH